MEVNGRAVVLLFLLMFMLFTPPGSPPRVVSPDERLDIKAYLRRQKEELAVLANSTWDSGFKGLTGLSKYPGDTSSEISILPGPLYDSIRTLWTKERPESAQYDGSDDGDEQLQLAPQGWFDPEVPNPLDYAYFHNISGLVRGEWRRMKLSLVPVNMTNPEINRNFTINETARIQHSLRTFETERTLDDRFGPFEKPGNMTTHSGEIRVSINELPTDKRDNERKTADSTGPGTANNVSLINMNIDLYESNDDVHHGVGLTGVHIKDSGNFVATTSSLKFSGINALPQMLIDEANFDETKQLVLERLKKSVNTDEPNNWMELNQQLDDFERAKAESRSCEYVVYGHVHAVHGFTPYDMAEVEDELMNPLGRPHLPTPSLLLDLIVYSPDCALALDTTSVDTGPLRGQRYQQFYMQVRWAIVAGIALLLGQTVIMALQMKDTNTPSMISGVSFYTVGLMAVMDGSIFMSALVASFLEEVKLLFMAVVFVAFALTLLFEMRYMVLIQRSPTYESIANARARESMNTDGQTTFVARPDGTIVSDRPSATAGAAAEAGTPAETGTPTPAPAPAPPAVTPPQDEMQTTGMVYSRLYFVILGFLMLSITAVSWPSPFRQIYEYAVVITLASLWVPQIYRNAHRGSRRSFLWKFVIGTSVIRAVPLLYLCLDTKNVVHHRYEPTLAASVILWLWVQICVLAAQQLLGPRFFLPRKYRNIYDYHPILTEDDLESALTYDDYSAAGKPGHGDHSGDRSAKEVVKPEPGSGSKSTGDTHLSPNRESSRDPLLPEEPKTGPKVDCAICMNQLQLVVVPRSGAQLLASTPANIIARRRYMVTPCRHVFHTECMERWMRTRLQCPVCRNPLPPI